MSDLKDPVEESSKQTTRKTSAIARPIQSIDVINKLVSVLFTYKRSVMYKDIATVVKLHPATVSQGLSASRDLGLTELAGKKGLYVLTKEGEEYARLMTAGKEGDAKLFLRKVIQSNPLWTDIMFFLKATRGQARDPLDLVLDIERKLGKKWSSGMRNRLRASYVSILSYVGLIQKEGNKIISMAEAAPEEPTKPPHVAPSAKRPPLASEDFAKLQTEDFSFDVRKDIEVLSFAREQFLAWIEYLRKKLEENKPHISR